MLGNKVQVKKYGDQCDTTGWYSCYAHKRNKIKLNKHAQFPACNFAGINCEGIWLLKREIKEKTEEEKHQAKKNQLNQRDRARNRHYNEDYYAQKEFDRIRNMWQFEK